MKASKLQDMSVPDLVKEFETLCLGQFQAEYRSDQRKLNRLVRQSMAVVDELWRRPGDQRSVLMQLYDHRNPQVRLMAAKETWDIAPSAARQVLQTLADSKIYPQAGDAGMSIWIHDTGQAISRYAQPTKLAK